MFMDIEKVRVIDLNIKEYSPYADRHNFIILMLKDA
jgi:hypothetical protein